MPHLVIEIQGGTIHSFLANMPMQVTLIDYYLKQVGGTVGQIVERLQPGDVRTSDEVSQQVTDIVNVLIDEGY